MNSTPQDCFTCSRPGTIGEQCATCIADEAQAAQLEADEEATASNLRKPSVKQTAGNNATLAKVKALMNKPIFERASKIMNEDGLESTLQFLSAHFREGVDIYATFVTHSSEFRKIC